MSILAGRMPHLPPTPRAAPAGELVRFEAERVVSPHKPPPAAKRDWTGWVSPSGLLVAVRRGRADCRGYFWWFFCLLCGSEREIPPWRLQDRTREMHTCGCGPRGKNAPRLRMEIIAARPPQLAMVERTIGGGLGA